MCLEQNANDLCMVQLMPLPSSLASLKSGMVLPFWYHLTQIVLEQRPLNGWSVVLLLYYHVVYCKSHVLYVLSFPVTVVVLTSLLVLFWVWLISKFWNVWSCIKLTPSTHYPCVWPIYSARLCGYHFGHSYMRAICMYDTFDTHTYSLYTQAMLVTWAVPFAIAVQKSGKYVFKIQQKHT